MEERIPEYEIVYKVDYKNLTKENFDAASDEMVTTQYYCDYDTEDAWEMEHGKLFRTEAEAMEAAKREYVNMYVSESSRPYNPVRKNYEICYEHDSNMLVITETACPSSAYIFDSIDDARRLLDEIGEENYARYALQLKDVPLMVLVSL